MQIKKQILNEDLAWNTVAVEERIDLMAKVQSQGILFGTASFLVIASIAYGLDQIMLLLVGLCVAFFTTPIFTNYNWRKEKPALILAYLAVRALAKRYIFAYRISKNELYFIYRAQAWQIGPNQEIEEKGDVWVCLFQGGLVVLKEQLGGAKLLFITAITNMTTCRKAEKNESLSQTAVVIEGTEISNGKKIILDSKFVGAQYVLERKMQQLIKEYVPPVSFLKGITSN